MDNISLARFFSEIADILELRGDDPFRIRAYRRAAQMIEAYPDQIASLSHEKLRKIPGIGEGIATKISEIISTGQLRFLEDLRRQVSPSLVALLQIPGLGPKKIQALHTKLAIEKLEDLESLIRAHPEKIAALEGFGAKTVENLTDGIEQFKRFKERALLGRVLPVAQAMVTCLKNVPGAGEVELAGSIRRMRETVKDIDILATGKEPEKLIEAFTHLPQVERILAKGSTKANVLLSLGIEADLRVVPRASWGAALHYFTGSKAHNIHIRTLGVKRGLKISEYGVFRVRGGKEVRVGGTTEEEVFQAVGLPWIPPELREDRGEIEAAEQGKLPKLIELSNLRGDCQSHTRYSDGTTSVLEMAEAAKKFGLSWLAITDHASPMGITGGLDRERIAREMEEIEDVREQIRGFRILKSCEVDILPDGTLALPDDLLEKFEVVVASIHSRFGGDQTARMIRAIENPHVDIIGHPTGRKIGEREPYELELEKVYEAAAKTGTALELNAFWDRLDLNDIQVREARARGCRIVISSDAHAPEHFAALTFGIAQARRGWLEARDVLTTFSAAEFLKAIKKG